MAKARRFWLGLHSPHLFGKGPRASSPRLLSRPTLTVQDVTVCSAEKPTLPSVATPACDLRPPPDAAPEVARQEKKEVLPHIRTCIARIHPTNALRSLVGLSIPYWRPLCQYGILLVWTDTNNLQKPSGSRPLTARRLPLFVTTMGCPPIMTPFASRCENSTGRYEQEVAPMPKHQIRTRFYPRV